MVPTIGKIAYCLVIILTLLPNSVMALTPYLDLSSPNPKIGGRLGQSVGGIEDVNGNGHPDILVGAAEEVFVMEGSTGAVIHRLSVDPSENASRFGASLSAVPDADGDGIDDIVVGARFTPSMGGLDGAGSAFLFSGQSGLLLRRIDSPNPREDARFGESVIGVPDLTGDGRGEVVIGAPSEGPDYNKRYGSAYVLDGSSGALLHTLNSTTPVDDGRFGRSLASIPDLTGDGIADIAVGAPFEGANPNVRGRVYIFDGAIGNLHYKLFLTGVSSFGYSVAGLEDITGDGRGDLAICNLYRHVFLYDGATKSIIRAINAPSGAGEFAQHVSVLKDFDANGTQDILVGAYREEYQGVAEAGAAHVFDSATGALLKTVYSPTFEVGGHFGISHSAVGDVNGDGRTDFIVGAQDEDPGTSPGNSGKAYVILGLFPEIVTNLESVEFGEIEAPSGQSELIEINLSNGGTQDLTVPCPGITLAGTGMTDFIVENLDWHCATGPNISVIPPGATESFSVRWQPTSIGVKNATLVIESDDPFTPVIEIPLTGTGVPQAPSVSIAPANPKTLDDLNAVVTPTTEAGAVNYEFHWYEDSVVLSAETSDTLDDSFTERDRVYACEVRSETGGFHSPIASASVTIRNSTPTEPVVEILPPDPVPNEELAVKISVDSTDDDGDTIVYLFEWYESEDGTNWHLRPEVSGTLYPYFRGLPVVSELYTQAADFWMVEVTPIEAQTLKKRAESAKGGPALAVVGNPGSDAVFVMPDLDGDLAVSSADLLDLLKVWHKRRDEIPEGMRPMFFDQGDPEDARIGVRHLYSIGLTGWYWKTER